MNSSVSIRKCETYKSTDVQAAVKEAVDLAGGLEVEGKRVLLKPNILRDADPGRAITTHPEVLRAVIALCRNRGAREVIVGDSPGFAPGGFSGKRSSLRQVTEEEGARWVDFHSGKTLREVPNPLQERAFHLAAVLDEIDAVISLPKLKTHSLMYFTGAMKNLFGLVPGLAKSPFHVRYPGREEFGEMIVDLVGAVKPHYAILDGIVGMEGAGPGNGEPRNVGVIMASPSCLALDVVASHLIGYDADDVPTNRIGLAHDQELESYEDIEIRGTPLEEVKLDDFTLIGSGDFSSFWSKVMRIPLLRKVEIKLRKKPAILHHHCIRCGDCVNICAAGALSMTKADGKKRVEIHYGRCIRCYCCHEICPADAIQIGKP